MTIYVALIGINNCMQREFDTWEEAFTSCQKLANHPHGEKISFLCSEIPLSNKDIIMVQTTLMQEAAKKKE